ncbi:uncharacterized protein [Triticum aestivum]|uniref:uncharacterized protein n=1 Tax=Triticum aestivum TaxID=4565 RepID=UPI001D03327C|nr:uncharacterized protein LOC123083237 [Triticum aestivum]
MAPGTCVAAIPDLPDAYKPPPRHRRPTLVLLAPISLCLPPQIPLLLDLRHGRVVGVAVADGLLAARDNARGTFFVAYFDYMGEIEPEATGTPAASPSSTSIRLGRRRRCQHRPPLLLLSHSTGLLVPARCWSPGARRHRRR